MKRVTLDFETRSACDLKKAGAYKYSLDPTTRPTCLAAKFRYGRYGLFLNFEEVNRNWDDVPELFRGNWQQAIKNVFEFSAHNAFFERCIYDNILVKRYGWPVIPSRHWRCTAAKAAACSLPRNLQDAGAAMRLSTQKDKRGYAAMMATCRPTKQYNMWVKTCVDAKAGKRLGEKRRKLAEGPAPKMFRDPEDAPDVWRTLYEYCTIDVKAEELLDIALPDLSSIEQELWFLNQKLNWRGLRIDIPTVKKIVDIMAEESTQKLKELDKLTMGLVTKPGARKSILEFLEIDGITLPDIKAKTVSDELDSFILTEDTRRLLEIRKALSMTSTRKYQAFLNRANDDNRVRDILLFCGASTGRDTGTGIQPHNFPKGLLPIDSSKPYQHIENVIECEKELLHILYGRNLGYLFSSVLRNMIIPSDGHELFVADFSKVEVAVLWWLAENEPGLKILRQGLDPYRYMAAANTGKKYEEISDKGDERQLGKAQILGCGFGMGAIKFQSTAWDSYRLKLTIKQSQMAVKRYREKNSRVPELWKEYEAAAINAVENPSLVVRAGKCEFQVRDTFLWMKLPSKRELAYKDPKISWRVREYDVIEPILNKRGEPILDKNGEEKVIITKKVSRPAKTLEFMAVHSKTKKWGFERSWGGTICENIVQATARELMMHAALRLEKAGYKLLLTVHDEAITEKIKGVGSVKEFTKIMCTRPEWADKYLPIDAISWSGPRYRKG